MNLTFKYFVEKTENFVKKISQILEKNINIFRHFIQNVHIRNIIILYSINFLIALLNSTCSSQMETICMNVIKKMCNSNDLPFSFTTFISIEEMYCHLLKILSIFICSYIVKYCKYYVTPFVICAYSYILNFFFIGILTFIEKEKGFFPIFIYICAQSIIQLTLGLRDIARGKLIIDAVENCFKKESVQTQSGFFLSTRKNITSIASNIGSAFLIYVQDDLGTNHFLYKNIGLIFILPICLLMFFLTLMFGYIEISGEDSTSKSSLFDIVTNYFYSFIDECRKSSFFKVVYDRFKNLFYNILELAKFNSNISYDWVICLFVATLQMMNGLRKNLLLYTVFNDLESIENKTLFQKVKTLSGIIVTGFSVLLTMLIKRFGIVPMVLLFINLLIVIPYVTILYLLNINYIKIDSKDIHIYMPIYIFWLMIPDLNISTLMVMAQTVWSKYSNISNNIFNFIKYVFLSLGNPLLSFSIYLYKITSNVYISYIPLLIISLICVGSFVKLIYKEHENM